MQQMVVDYFILPVVETEMGTEDAGGEGGVTMYCGVLNCAFILMYMHICMYAIGRRNYREELAQLFRQTQPTAEYSRSSGLCPIKTPIQFPSPLLVSISISISILSYHHHLPQCHRWVQSRAGTRMLSMSICSTYHLTANTI